MRKIFFSVLLIISQSISQITSADDAVQEKTYHLRGNRYFYQMPSNFNFITTIPKNYLDFFKNSFSFNEENLKGWAAIIASTAILIHYDQSITNDVQRLGRKVGIGNAENTKATLRVGGSALLRRPSDLGSLMYFIGDGWITIGFAGGFLTAGLISKDERELVVTHELIQGLLLTGLTTQIIKRSTGRESPVASTQPGGRWRFFPSSKNFQERISKYDAFPSGHLATTMTTFMILSENYQEYTWIKPVGYTLMSLLSFQMVNNSVHWAGDYPLALGIGYMLGKTIVANGRKKIGDDPSKTDVTVLPVISPDGKIGMNALINY